MSTQNRPLNYLDAQSRVIFDSVDDTSFRGEYDGSNNLIYKAFARPGASESALVWQIAKLAYTGTNIISIKWPQNASSVASNDYAFSWTNRATYTYS